VGSPVQRPAAASSPEGVGGGGQGTGALCPVLQASGKRDWAPPTIGRVKGSEHGRSRPGLRACAVLSCRALRMGWRGGGGGACHRSERKATASNNVNRGRGHSDSVVDTVQCMQKGFPEGGVESSRSKHQKVPQEPSLLWGLSAQRGHSAQSWVGFPVTTPKTTATTGEAHVHRATPADLDGNLAFSVWNILCFHSSSECLD
jgi:hypothetical protein